MTARKPPSRRQNRITNDIGVVQGTGSAPPMPRGLCRQAAAAWQAYWDDPVSSVATTADIPIINRWVKDLDRYYRLSAEADRNPIVTGYNGQPAGNPLYTLALKILASIKEDERQIGIGPSNRLKLGIVFGAATHTLADLKSEIAVSADDDPRLTVVIDADSGAEKTESVPQVPGLAPTSTNPARRANS